MTRTLQARYDGRVFLPDPQEEIPIPPETEVRITIEVSEAEEGRPGKTGTPYSFLDIALSNPLEGPPDWAENLDEYLYGGRKLPE